VTLMPTRLVGCGLALCAAAAVADDVPRSALATLALTGEVSCQPAFPVFCRNIHVSCSVPSSIRTFPFKLRASGPAASIDAAADVAGVADRYAGGRAEWDTEEGYVVVRPDRGNGYVKLLADGSYSFRHYVHDEGLMSRGHCHP
jgi:hypothetical protein